MLWVHEPYCSFFLFVVNKIKVLLGTLVQFKVKGCPGLQWTGGLRAWGSEIRQTCQSGQCAYHEATSPREPREKASEIGQGWGIAIVIATVPLKAQEKWQEAQRKAKDVDDGDASKALLRGWGVSVGHPVERGGIPGIDARLLRSVRISTPPQDYIAVEMWRRELRY